MAENKVYYPFVHVEEVTSILNKIAIFGGLNQTQLAEVFKRLEVVRYEEGEFIYEQGNAPSHIYIIKKGEVKIMVDAEETSLELASFGVGDCFGETSVIGIQSHSTNALASASTELIVLERSALLKIFEEDKELFGMLILNIARETARRLHRLDEALTRFIVEEQKHNKGPRL